VAAIRKVVFVAISIFFSGIFIAAAVQPASASANEVKANCAHATEGDAECLSLQVTGSVTPAYPGTGEDEGLSPENLHAAYDLPVSGGSGQTVAIVDAYNNPDAEANLATYREKYGLPACTEANGCFKKVNQNGETGNYPLNESGWSVEMSLDVDMVSAICSECHITLVEATSNSYANLDTAENEAAALAGTTVISDSWGSPETGSRASEGSYFDHPGIPIAVAAGDYCYRNECEGYDDPNWPAASPYVIAVGGTRLEKSTNARGWSESVWYEPDRALGTGSGCSAYESKPAWQTDADCSDRASNDVSAVGACESPLSIYDSYGDSGWVNECGTSAATPIIASVEAMSNAKTRDEGAEAFWKLGPEGKLFDVTEGDNWYSSNCGSYLCNATTGYDGPTGWGTPDGVFHVGGWGTQTTPNPVGATEIEFKSVSCVSATECEGVGQYLNASKDAAFAEQWSGSKWTLQEVPLPSGAKNDSLESVSCTSASACTAVGRYEGTSATLALTERWNGTKWSIQEATDASGATRTELSSVACTSVSACQAVGEYRPSGGSPNPAANRTFAEAWNGTTWSTQTIPSSGTLGSELNGVACTASDACTAVGSLTDGTVMAPGAGPTEKFPLAERWNGTAWSVESTPAPSERGDLSELTAVSCSDATTCMATGGTGVTLFAEEWQGSKWTVLTVPGPETNNGQNLYALSCVSATDCIAVGSYDLAGGSAALGDQWNGSKWVLQLPESKGYKTSLYGVSCTAAETCEAGGTKELNGSEYQTSLAENLEP
jgi:hypothetical protein